MAEVFITRDSPTEESVQQAWEVYCSIDDDKHPFPQLQRCYTQEVFVQAMKSGEYIKILLLEEGRIIGLGLIATDLENARRSNINPVYFRKQYPDHAERELLFYVAAMCILPEYQDRGLNIALMQAFIECAKEEGAIFIFDLSKMNNGNFPTGLKRTVKATGGDIEITEHDVQLFFSAHLI